MAQIPCRFFGDEAARAEVCHFSCNFSLLPLVPLNSQVCLPCSPGTNEFIFHSAPLLCCRPHVADFELCRHGFWLQIIRDGESQTQVAGVVFQMLQDQTRFLKDVFHVFHVVPCCSMFSNFLQEGEPFFCMATGGLRGRRE